MKTKNVKVRVEDIKHGRIIYTAHPVYGISKWKVAGKPYFNRSVGALFVPYVSCGNASYKSERSLRDAGITAGNSYNGRRSFFKLKQAEEWVKKWKDDKGFIAQQREHEEYMKAFSMRWY